ncbi:MAG: hypothetical protein EOP45_17845 [Sphingobacteriaceae bacterium]|nr:MAG: hypothetical protein EOP45_17845 [Sphingobacteriaceae bacterium]
MISVIICSRGPEFRIAVVENIATTIGVPYEIVAIDNSENKYGICAAYNEGAARSQYSILCFAHEDIEFRTNDWGKTVARLLADNSIGVVGVAGGKWLANAPGTWWSCGNKYVTTNILDLSPKQNQAKYTYSNPEGKLLVDVAAVDGLWICTRKSVWERHPFDEKTFPDFHFYDVDFCANMFREYRICVTMEVDIVHYSLGNYNDSWYLYADTFYRKHTHHLPLGIPQLSTAEEKKHEYSWSIYFIHAIIDRELPVKLGYKYVLNCLKIAPFKKDTLWLAQYYAKFAWRNRNKEIKLR